MLDKLHKVQLEMGIEVKGICEKHNIKYSIIAGTLLGAVRHKGFIPWDDDLDIGMLRKDFDRFIEVCEKELRDKYFLQTWETDCGFALPIAKIRKNGTRFVEKSSSKADLHSGIYIDIFPFDNVPNSRCIRIFQDKSTYILKRILLIKMDYILWEDDQFVKKTLYKILKVFSRIVSIKNIKKILYKIMTISNNKESEKVVAIGGAYTYKKESIKREWLEAQRNIEFEDTKFSAPVDYIDYLKYFYGAYMTPPPEDKRQNRHKIIDLSFEEEN